MDHLVESGNGQRNSGTEPGGSPHWGLLTAETAEGAEMNGVNELTNEIIGAAIDVSYTSQKGIRRLVHELPKQSLRSPVCQDKPG